MGLSRSHCHFDRRDFGTAFDKIRATLAAVRSTPSTVKQTRALTPSALVTDAFSEGITNPLAKTVRTRDSTATQSRCVLQYGAANTLPPDTELIVLIRSSKPAK